MKYLYHHRTQGLNVEGVHIRSICNALKSLGHDVRLVSVMSTNDQYWVTPVSKDNANPNKKPSLLKSIAKKLPEPMFELLELSYNFYAFFRLWKVIHNYRPERIYERYSLFLFSTLLLGKIYRIPVVYELNDSAKLDRLRPLYFQRIALWIEKQTYQHATGLVYVSQRIKQIIQTAYALKTPSVVTPNASDKSVFFFDKDKKSLAKSYLNLQTQTVCGFIGCFARWHGVHHFMEKIAPVIKEHPQLTLLLIGDGETLTDVQAIIDKFKVHDQVILTGNITHSEVIKYVRAMDLSVLPSSNEYGSPMKMFELMGAGVPLIAADYPPIAEIISDNIDGWLFPKGDFNACINTLLEFYNQPDLIHRVAVAAENKIHAHHQWSDNAADLENLFSQSEEKHCVCQRDGNS